MNNINPNFFIVGAAKSGTSSLWEYLKQNKDVFMPEDELDKEPAFFSNIKNHSMELNDYLSLFGAATEKMIGEASTAYLTDPNSPKHIYAFNSEAKIIIMLRNPADRAYSLYNWMTQEGYEHAGTFTKALKLESKRRTKSIPNFFEPEYYWNYMYFNSGLYSMQVQRYLDLFQDNVLVIKFEEFKNDTERIYRNICEFLGIEMNQIMPHIYNASKSVYSPKVQFSLRKLSFYYNVLNNKIIPNKKTDSKAKRDKILKLGIRNKSPKVLDGTTKHKLMKIYEEDILRLSELTGVNFGDWLN